MSARMDQLLEKLLPSQQPEAVDGSVTVLRQQAQKNLLKFGLPGLHDERWKYTSLKLLERRDYSVGEFDDEAALQTARTVVGELPSAGMVVFSNQHCLLALAPEWMHSLESLLLNDDSLAAAALQADELVQANSADGFMWLNLTRSQAGLVFDLAAGQCIDQPVHIVYLDQDAAQACHWRHHWRLGEGARLTLVEHYHFSGAGLGNIYRSIELAGASELNWLSLQQTGNDYALIQHNHITQHAGARCDQQWLDLGARLARQETRVNLSGVNASFAYAGLLLGRQRQHHDQHVLVNHQATQCHSQQTYRAVLDGHARGVVNTAACVLPGADGSDVQQNTASLLLSNQAEMDAKPELEIHADEVVASHGATIGQLDEDAVFYLRSRGIPEAKARQMLVGGFVRSIAARVTHDELREYAETLVNRRLEQML